jgi:hypothetical protein
MYVVGLLAFLFLSTVASARPRGCWSDSAKEIASATIAKYTLEAFPQWAAHHDAAGCPPSLDALGEYMNGDGVDPWGRDYVMSCDPHADKPWRTFAVVSRGPDRRLGTDDDVRHDR